MNGGTGRKAPAEALRAQLQELGGLRNANARDPVFKAWRQNTLTLIQRVWPGDPTRAERFRRVPFSSPSSKMSANTRRQFFERGCSEAIWLLREWIEDAHREQVSFSEPGGRSAPTLPGSQEDDFPVLDLPADGSSPAQASNPAVNTTPLAPDEPLSASPPRAAGEKSEAPPPPLVSPFAEPLELPPAAPARKPEVPASPAMPAKPAAGSGYEAELDAAMDAIMDRKGGRRAKRENKRSAPKRALKEMLGFTDEIAPALPPESPPVAEPVEPVEALAAAADSAVEPEPAAANPFEIVTPPVPVPEPPIAFVRPAPPIAAVTADAPAGSADEPDTGLPEFEIVAEHLAPAAEAMAAEPAPGHVSTPPVPGPIPFDRIAAADADADAAADAADAAEMDDFLNRSPVLGASPKPVRPRPVKPLRSPTGSTLASLAMEVGHLGVPEGQRAAVRAMLLDLAREFDENRAAWDTIRHAVVFVMEYPSLARRVLLLLIPHLDQAA